MISFKKNIKKILLISPPGKVYILPDGTPSARKHCAQPLGMAYLAAILLNNNYDVHVIDMLAEGYDKEVYHKPFIVYGLTVEDVLSRIENEKPDIIGISVLYSFLIKEIVELCSSIKAKYPDIPILLGGHHPSGVPKEVMKNDSVDYILVGEAEISIIKFLEYLKGNISLNEVPNLFYKCNGEIKSTFTFPMSNVRDGLWHYYKAKEVSYPLDLDDLPFPAWDIFPVQAYWKSKVRIGGGDVARKKGMPMSTSRGCPNACSYCLSSLISGYKSYRRRSNEHVLKEIRWLVDKYKVEEITFYDDNFFVNKTKTKDLLRSIAKEFPDILFNTVGGIEARFMDEEIIDLMAEANFYKALIAIESGDQDLQNSLIDKRVNISKLPMIVDYFKNKDIETRGLFMIGFPGETRKQINKTVELAKSLNLDDFYFSIVTPIPGTPLFDECMDKNLFIDGFNMNDVRFAAAKLKLPDTTPEELERIRRETWLEAFMEKRKKRDSYADDRFIKFEDIEEYENVGFTSLKKIKD